MRVISTTDLSRYGNDCYIYESISLTEQFGVYAVIIYQRVVGWPEREGAFVLESTTEQPDAIAAYKKYGGIYEAISID